MIDPAPDLDHIAAFRDAMREAGIDYRGPIDADGVLHRVHVEGDRAGSKNAWYVVHIDERPAGAFGCNKRYGDRRLSWTAKGVAPLTADDRRRLKEKEEERRIASAKAKASRQADAALRAVSMWEGAKEATTHPYLTAKGVQSHGLRVGTFVRELRPAENGDQRQHRTANTLLIPIKNAAKELVSLQAIFAEPQKWNGDARTKDFIYGGEKAGCWFAIGKAIPGDDGRKVVLIAEGYATAATIHEATGHGVIVAFDAGNLRPVGEAVRRLMPKARIIFAADNDQWTKEPVENPGVFRARQAADAVGGEVVSPWFRNVDGHPTDFNDLRAMEGGAAVRQQILAVVSPRREDPNEPPPVDEIPDQGEPHHDDLADGEPKKRKPGSPPPVDEDLIENDSYFRFLGYTRGEVHFFQREKNMRLSRRDSDWSDNALLTLAPLAWWERIFPGSPADRRKMAVNWLIRKSYEAGFHHDHVLRGRGAWIDNGRIVFNMGDRLLIDGEEVDLNSIESEFIYEQGRAMPPPAEKPLSSEDGKRIVALAQQFAFTRPASAILLAGWVALAPVCGALRWRPHIWITGGTGSGKTTVMDSFIKLLNRIELFANGDSTEPGLRGEIKNDAIPGIIDEAESNTDRAGDRMEATLTTVRQSSSESGARTYKGVAGGSGTASFRIRSMWCLSSVQVGMKEQADKERITVLSMRPKKGDEDPVQTWARISAAIDAIKADREIPAMLLKRSLVLLPTTLKNIETFSKAAALRFGSQREGDQYGTLLAGAWSLVTTKLATLEQAQAMIERYDWTDYLEATETEESTKALQALLGRLIRGPKGQDVSVYEVVCSAAGCETATFKADQEDSVGLLQRYGMQIKWDGGIQRVDSAFLLVANSSNELARLMANTSFSADLTGQLLRVPGAKRWAPIRFNGVSSRSVGVPLATVIGGDAQARRQDVIVDDDIAF
jgi:putative DNA primase/helicase